VKGHDVFTAFIFDQRFLPENKRDYIPFSSFAQYFAGPITA
jgi:hypothetical protein